MGITDPEMIFVTADFGDSDLGIAGIGGALPDKGLYKVKVTEFDYKGKEGKRKQMWLTLTIQGGPHGGYTIFEYQNVPQTGDKPGVRKFFNRLMGSLGHKIDQIRGLRGQNGLKVNYFLGREGHVWYEPPVKGVEGSRHAVTYILPDEVAMVQSGEIKIKDQNVETAQTTPALGGGLDTSNNGVTSSAAVDRVAAALG